LTSPNTDAAAAVSAVLWDLDGTLIDTEPLYAGVIAEVCGRFGHAFTPADNEQIFGKDGAATCSYLMSRFAMPLSGEALMRQIVDRFMASVGAEHGRAEAVALVRALAGRGVPQACVSNSPVHMIRHHLDLLAIADAFGCLVGRDLVARGKPHPDPYLHACAALGVPPAACIAVEDTPTGVVAARAAGVTVIACPTALTAHLDFSAAHHRVARIDEFPWEAVVAGRP
jgi:beta-phosphoglucomutase-like phosphatase (HAD superfamily)